MSHYRHPHPPDKIQCYSWPLLCYTPAWSSGWGAPKKKLSKLCGAPSLWSTTHISLTSSFFTISFTTLLKPQCISLEAPCYQSLSSSPSSRQDSKLRMAHKYSHLLDLLLLLIPLILLLHYYCGQLDAAAAAARAASVATCPFIIINFNVLIYKICCIYNSNNGVGILSWKPVATSYWLHGETPIHKFTLSTVGRDFSWFSGFLIVSHCH